MSTVDSKVKILVVEDEIIIADNICGILEDLGYEVLAPVIEYGQAIKALDKFSPDLVILDIQLAGVRDGIDLAWKIKDDYGVPFIFLTSNADAGTVERVKKLSPPAYLVKPFRKDDLYTSIEIALFNAQEQKSGEQEDGNFIVKDAFFIKNKNAFSKVRFDEIVYLQIDHVYVEIYTSEKKHIFRDSFKNVLSELPDFFFQVHRSYAINLNLLESIEQGHVIVSGVSVPLAKTNKDKLIQLIQVK